MGFFKQTWVKILIVVILVLVVGSTAACSLGTRQNQPNASSQTTPSASSPTSIASIWQTYTDAKLRATFEYPTTWKLIHTKSDPSQTGVGSDYDLAFEDTTIPNHAVSIYISSISNPDKLSLADFYRKNLPNGAERYANIAFQETINPHGVRFEKIIQPYVSPDYNDTLETVHYSRIYEITKTIAVPLSTDMPVGGDYHQDPKFQEAVTEYNHLINSFTFIDEGTN